MSGPRAIIIQIECSRPESLKNFVRITSICRTFSAIHCSRLAVTMAVSNLQYAYPFFKMEVYTLEAQCNEHHFAASCMMHYTVANVLIPLLRSLCACYQR